MSLPGAPEPGPASSWTFVVVAFVVSAAIGGVVVFLGVTGQIGGGIVGGTSRTGGSGGGPSPYAGCEGFGRAGPYDFALVAGEGGTFTFNGTSPGPCLAVDYRSTVTVDFSVAADAGANHSFVVINTSAALDSPPAFAGAGPSNATRLSGFAPGTHIAFTFVAAAVGSYRYLCEVPGHEAAGMFGSLYVLVPPGAAAVPPGSSGTAVPAAGAPPAMRAPGPGEGP